MKQTTLYTLNILKVNGHLTAVANKDKPKVSFQIDDEEGWFTIILDKGINYSLSLAEVKKCLQ